MIKTLFILSSSGAFGGASKSFMTMMKGLMQKDVVPIVVLPEARGLYAELKQLGIKTYILPLKRNCYPKFSTFQQKIYFGPVLLSRVVNNYKVVRKLKQIIHLEQIDIVHTNSSIIDVGLRAAKALRKPHVCHIREYGDKDFQLYYMPSRSCYRRAISGKKCYTISITKDICRYHGFSAQPNARVIYNGIAPQGAVMPSEEKEKFFLYAGRIEPAKGVEQLVEAYVEYARNMKVHFPLLLAGEETNPTYSATLRKSISESGIMAEAITFLGVRKDIDQLMRRAQAIIVPSRFEAFGRCMPEAMFNGCLAIGRNTGGTREQFDNGLELQGQEIGLRYETTAELTQCLIDVTKNGLSYYDEMIRRGFDTVNKLYSNEANINNVYNLYLDILKDVGA